MHYTNRHFTYLLTYTLRALPWAGGGGKRRVGEVLCEASWIAPYLDGAPVTACTRYMARTQLERLSTLGYQFMSGYEAKFFVYRNGGDREVTDRPLFHGDDFASSLIIEEHAELVYSMAELLSAAGIDVAAVNNEGSSGQLEFATGTKFGIESPDQMFTLKEAVKEIALGRGCQATFMTMPTYGPGFSCGMHFNGSLWTGDKNAFHDPADSQRLSADGRHWTAGLVKHAAALTALLSPTVNCYRRVHQLLTPDRANCGSDNRNASFRIVASSPRTTYVENRLPSSAANPYVVLAATVAAGVDGLLNHLEQSSESKDHGDKLPSSLPEALSALEADKVLCDALGRQFIRWFSTVKSDVEIAKVNRAKEEGLDDLQVERELYFKFL